MSNPTSRMISKLLGEYHGTFVSVEIKKNGKQTTYNGDLLRNKKNPSLFRIENVVFKQGDIHRLVLNARTGILRIEVEL